MKQGNVVQENFKTTIPFKYVYGWIILEVKIENKSYNFLLDTGSSNLLTKELAEELNVEIIGSEEITDINNKGNETQYANLRNIKIGNIDFQNTIAGIVDLNNIIEVGCSKIDGIIGSNLMRKAVWDFDFEKQLITITNDENKLDVPTNAIVSKIFIGTAGIPSVTLKINGKNALNTTVDFGNAGSNFLRTDIFNKQLETNLITKYVKGNNKAFGAFGRSEENPFYSTIIDEMKIGNHTVNNIFTNVKNGDDNNLGLVFFKNYRVILNWNKKKLKMIEVTKAGNDSYKTYGFSTLYEKEEVYVNSVVETSSASEFLKNGDKILSINDTTYRDITEEQYCDILNDDFNNGKEPLSIRVIRDNKELTFKIIKKELL
ncbi:aspartyl protease family protein [Zobellia nedashkovskayae]